MISGAKYSGVPIIIKIIYKIPAKVKAFSLIGAKSTSGDSGINLNVITAFAINFTSY